MLVGEAVVVGRAGVAAQGFPEARESGWSGLSLLSCSSYTGHSWEVLGGAQGQLAHFWQRLEVMGRTSEREEKCPGAWA